jgi:hypothetical protein
VTREPVECTRETIELTLEWFDQHGVEMMAQCEYTSAPATSPRPVGRGVDHDRGTEE